MAANLIEVEYSKHSTIAAYYIMCSFLINLRYIEMTTLPRNGANVIDEIFFCSFGQVRNNE